jgi:hypothetical protein
MNKIDEWVHDRLIAARIWYAALPWYSRAWLRFKWWAEPGICRIRCFFTGETCPWE